MTGVSRILNWPDLDEPTMQASVCILQSYDDTGMTPWLQACQSSVKAWCNVQGYTYRFVDDDLFEDVPDWYMQKVAGRKAIAADLGRLQWITRLLGEFDVVMWLDIDVLVWAPEALRVNLQGRDCVFGQEAWLQEQDGKLRVYRSVHNAYLGFARASSTLPFLIDTILHLMAKVDPNHIAPQFVGPKLLTSLHNTVGFALEPRVGALSELFIARFQADQESAVTEYVRHLRAPLYAANLCLTLCGSTSSPELNVASEEEASGCSAERLMEQVVTDLPTWAEVLQRPKHV